MRPIDSNIFAKLRSGEIIAFALLDMTIDGVEYNYTDCDVPIPFNNRLYTPRKMVCPSINYGTNNIVDQAQLDIVDLDQALSPAFIGGTPQGSPVRIIAVVLDADYKLIGGYELIDCTAGTPGTGWSAIDADTAVFAGAAATSYFADVATGLVADETYTISFGLTGYSGSGDIGISTSCGVSVAARLSSNGIYTEDFVSNGSNVRLFGQSTNSGTLENLSVKLANASNHITLFEGEIGEWDYEEGKVAATFTNQFAQWAQKTLSTYSASCRWKVFKGIECGYTGDAVTCDRTYAQCEAYNNTANFGGFRWLPSIIGKDIWWGREQGKEPPF